MTRFDERSYRPGLMVPRKPTYWIEKALGGMEEPMQPGDFNRTDYSVVVKSRGNTLNPWKWEIYRAGRSSATPQDNDPSPRPTKPKTDGV